LALSANRHASIVRLVSESECEKFTVTANHSL
jgi:hypothetical protein